MRGAVVVGACCVFVVGSTMSVTGISELSNPQLSKRLTEGGERAAWSGG